MSGRTLARLGRCIRARADASTTPQGRMTRILTYNVHRCLGIDGVLDPGRIAAVIAACQPDIVALQEVDGGRLRTGGVDRGRSRGRSIGPVRSTSCGAASRTAVSPSRTAVAPPRARRRGRLPDEGAAP